MFPSLPSFRLDGKHALVVGAGRGLGAASAIALAEAGARVTVASRTVDELDEVASYIRQQGGSADYEQLDATNPDAVKACVQTLGPIDVLVNSAGTNRPLRLEDVDQDDIDYIFDVNLKAALYLAREVSISMKNNSIRGSIITLSSQMGHVGGPKRTLYCASKHALEGMTKALAWELGPVGIRVNTLCPTFFRTPLTEPMLIDPVFRSFVIDRIALGRIGELQDIMGPVVFLASEASALVTGTALMVDGGWTAQ
ncbi:MAG: SDR family oxidoreductase [Betaproteobacteria bacterium]|jgi:NAD(P)-dependent dehydrogenase (short-subunit alcohol dehydrogenase family)|nr:SDR family oxidoreductase [Betaproteobacteria bacterium]